MVLLTKACKLNLRNPLKIQGLEIATSTYTGYSLWGVGDLDLDVTEFRKLSPFIAGIYFIGETFKSIQY